MISWVNVTKLAVTADLVTFTEEIFSKNFILCAVKSLHTYHNQKQYQIQKQPFADVLQNRSS